MRAMRVSMEQGLKTRAAVRVGGAERARGPAHYNRPMLLLPPFHAPTARVAAGFTLIEILVVIVILGVLAALIVPQRSSSVPTRRASSPRRATSRRSCRR